MTKVQESMRVSCLSCFSRLSRRTHRQPVALGGTGLGLSIVRCLAQHMQGDADVFSRVGEGSRFWFTVCCPRVALNADSRRMVCE